MMYILFLPSGYGGVLGLMEQDRIRMLQPGGKY